MEKLCQPLQSIIFLPFYGCNELPGAYKRFERIVLASQALIHNGQRQEQLRDEFFRNDSTALAHRAIRLGE